MTRTTPGRLYRKLPPSIGRPLFGFYSPDMSLYDEGISSVTITRGSTSRGGGLTPSIMEITVPGAVSSAVNGSLCRFFMRAVPADRLGDLVGQAGPSIESRYQGRLGAVTVDDDGERFTSTITASSFTQQLLVSSAKKHRPLAGQTIARVLNQVFGLLDGTQIAGIDLGIYGTYDRVSTSETDSMTFSDVVDKYAASLGILIRETRAGRTEAYTSTYRRDLATGSQLNSMPHLTRAQSLAPATWQQSNEQPGLLLDYLVTNENGAVVTRTAEIETNMGTVEDETEDWSHVYADTLQTNLEAYGRVYERSARQSRLESVSIDLLHLISSPYEYHRMQAGNLLTLEPGDPVYLAGDWPAPLRGVHFAQQIKETITGDSWQLDLSLHPITNVLGTVSPSVPARVWDSAINAWDEESRTWATV